MEYRARVVQTRLPSQGEMRLEYEARVVQIRLEYRARVVKMRVEYRARGVQISQETG